MKFALGLLLLLTSSTALAAGGWESMGVTDGVQVYRREIPGSPIIAFRGDGIVNEPLIKIAMVVLDDDRSQEWVDSLVSAKVVRLINPHEYIEYNHIGMPPLVSDRDFVTDVKMDVDPSKQTFTLIYRSVDDPLMPPGKYVRANMIYSIFVLTSIDHGTKTHVQAELQADPKGWLPKFLVNFFQKSWPVGTFEGLRKQAAKTDLKRAPVFAQILNEVADITR